MLKRGPRGAAALPKAIPTISTMRSPRRGFPVEVYNVLGAGDAFLAGFLRGYLKDEALETALRFGNACGAIVVSRHGCAPAMPTWPELQHFLSAEQPPLSGAAPRSGAQSHSLGDDAAAADA